MDEIEKVKNSISELERRMSLLEPDIFNIKGLIETVTTIPTKTPSSFWRQFKIYFDSISTPTVKRLYIYSNKTNSWYYISLT